MTRDRAVGIIDVDHGVDAFMQEQRPIAVVCGRRLLLRQQNIRHRIVEGEILGAALHQNIAGANVIANRRQVFALTWILSA
jgi:hypothetical protein